MGHCVCWRKFPSMVRLIIAPMFSLLLVAAAASAEPATAPFVATSDNDASLFNAAVRVGDGWLAVGDHGRIAAVRQGRVTYYASPLRANWQYVSTVPNGEWFVATDSGATVAVLRGDNDWILAKPSQCGEIRALFADGPDSAWLACSANRVFHWVGPNWLEVQNISDFGSNPRLMPLGGAVVLLGGSDAWQLEPGRAGRYPFLDKFAAAVGKGNAPEWGMRNDELFRFRGKQVQRVGRAPTDGTLAANENGVLVTSPTAIMRVSGGRLVRLGPDYYNFDWIGVAPTAEGAVVLTKTGKELRLTDRRETKPSFEPTGANRIATKLGIPALDAFECGATSDDVDEGKEPQPNSGANSVSHRGLFVRDDEAFALAFRSGELTSIDVLNGQTWNAFIGPEILRTWPGTVASIGGGREPSSDLWFAGCGYLVHGANGKVTRQVLQHKECLKGFFQGSRESFFFGAGRFVLRRHGDEWISEPTPVGIKAMCERDGQVYAVPDQLDLPLLVRRERGYFAEAKSDGSWEAAVAGREFGTISGLGGARDDGYILVDGRIEHYDGHTWTSLQTDSGLGLKALGYANGWAVALGEDGFVYMRARSAAGQGFTREPHLEGTHLLVESRNEITVSSANSIYRFDGKSWSAQPVPASAVKTKKEKAAVVGFARWHGKLHAFQASGRVLVLEANQWRAVAGSETIAQIPKIPTDITEPDGEANTGAIHPFMPCAVLQPTAQSLVLVSCHENWMAIFHDDNWTSFPLSSPKDPSGNVACVGGDGCYVLNPCVGGVGCYD